MADDIEGLEPEEEEAPAGEKDWKAEALRLGTQNKELLAEVKAARQSRRTQFLGAHPEFTEEDIKGVNLNQLEGLLAKIKAPAADAAPEGKPQEPAAPAAPEIPALAKAQELSGIQTKPVGEFFTAEQVRQIGIKDQAEALRIVAEGRMKSP